MIARDHYTNEEYREEGKLLHLYRLCCAKAPIRLCHASLLQWVQLCFSTIRWDPCLPLLQTKNAWSKNRFVEGRKRDNGVASASVMDLLVAGTKISNVLDLSVS